MYISRTAEKIVKTLSKQFKVVLVTGARQVGKSTLLKYCDKNREYVSLDDLTERQMALEDPKMFLSNHKPPVIIDEIQYAPSLLSYIKLYVDNSDKYGQYWLIGPQQFHLMRNVSESLAGRVGIIDLMGFSLSEIQQRKSNGFFDPNHVFSKSLIETDIFEVIYRGFYPRLHDDIKTDRDNFFNGYLRTYIERDLRALSKVSDEMLFLKFLRILAARTAQVIKYSEIAKEIGISQPTVKSWLSILVSSNLVYLLPPYYKNINKRMTKLPKLYFLDTGLAAFLTGWSSSKVIEKGAMNGAFFETFVVSEILKSYLHNGKIPLLYWYRDTLDREIDLILEKDGLLHPIEIKHSLTPSLSMTKNFNLIENQGMGALICMCDKPMFLSKNVKAIPVTCI